MCQIEELQDFTLNDRLKSFAGTVTYRNQFHVDNVSAQSWLNLGRLHCVSELEVNGVPLGQRWYGDHLYEISTAIHPGTNYLSIKLVTTLGNYMKTLKRNKAAQAWTAETPFAPMGLIAPIRLLYLKQQA